jgi:hypothetical protein
MPPVVIKPGVVFWPKGLVGQKIHPWIVLSHPVDGNVLLVNLSDEAHDGDAECVLNVGEHPCITKPSYVYFAEYEERPSKKMGHVLAEGRLVTHYADLSPEILERVLRAARSSADLSDDVKIRYGLLIPRPDSDCPF